MPFTREIGVDEQIVLPHFKQALDGISRAVQGRMSCALLAPAGTGKTALLRRLTDSLPEARYQMRYLKVTGLSKRDLCREIAAACGLRHAGTYPMLVRRIQEHFDAAYSTDGLRPILILDDAHDLRPDVLSVLKILTNFEMDSKLVLSIVLVGQPLLRASLQRPEFEDIARRLHHYATLRLLSRDETQGYIEHRVAIAGATTTPFDRGAFDALFELSRGNLRAVDRLALGSLECAALANAKTVSSAQVIAARKNLMP